MTPYAFYQMGELNQAVTALGEELRSNPLDSQRRTFLFELLCFAGEYDRAEKQLDVLANQAQGSASAGLLAYRSALHAQRTREAMFRAGSYPLARSEPGGSGSCNGTPFGVFEDTDPRIAENLELFVAGSYTWVPLRFVQALSIEEPAHLRDLLWARGRITLVPDAPFQEMGEVFLPVLTPLAHKHPDGAVRLGRATVWAGRENGEQIPEGQKLFQVDDEELPFLDVRSITWERSTKENG